MNEKAPVLTPTESRQASPRRVNLRVLIISLALAIFVGAMLYNAIYTNPPSSIDMPDQGPAPATNEQTPPAP